MPHLSIYDVRDYRRFLFAHLQLLSGLCTLSMRAVNDSIGQLLSSLFVTTQLRPQIAFHEQIGSIIEQTKSDAPSKFIQLLSLLRTTNHGNAIMTAYGTNFEYIDPWYNKTTSVAITRPIVYDNGCSCASVANCTTQAGFIDSNSSEIVLLIGIKMGCTPSESFLLSTLECFYNASCITLIRQTINGPDADNHTADLPLVTANGSRFSIDSTIIDLIQRLFIEDWSVTASYSSYFNQCSPALCSYTYTQQINSLYTITAILGLSGGLTFILKWICPKTVHLLTKVYAKRRIQRSVDAATVEATDATMTVTNPLGLTVDLNSVSTVPTSPYTLSFCSCTQHSSISLLGRNCVPACCVVSSSVLFFSHV